MLLWADDFNKYGVGGIAHMLEGPYAEVSAVLNPQPDLVADPAGSGKTVIKMASTSGAGGENSPSRIRRVLPSAKTTVGTAFRLWMSNLPTSLFGGPMLRFADAANAVQLTLKVTPTGAIGVYRGPNDTGTLLGTSTVALTASAWHFIEVKAVFNGTTGSVVVKVNNTTVLTLTGQNTLNTANVECSNVSIGRINHNFEASDTYLKDFIVWDTSGTYNNDFFGVSYVGSFSTDADVTLNWTPDSGGVGFSRINEAGPNDTSLISAASGVSASLFGLANLPSDATAVKGFVMNTRAKKSDSGSAQIQASVDLAGVVSAGADRQITEAFTYWSDVIEVNTGTGLPFSPTDWNALRYKIHRTA